MGHSILTRIQRALFAHSGGYCSKCRTSITEPNMKSGNPTVIGEIAHISGRLPGSPRYDDSISETDRCSYDNLIVLCATCHKIVDEQYETYTIEYLRSMKRHHEIWVTESLKASMPDVAFTELESVLRYIASGQAASGRSYYQIPPKDKIDKNSLSSEIEGMIKMGMSRVKEVERYIKDHPDIRFGERLKAGFVAEYENRKEEGLVGDSLFMSLVLFAGRGGDQACRSAGLVVLVYLFEKCEVFEK